MFQAQMNEMLRNPQLLDHIIASNPMLQSMGPQARELMQSDLFRQMMTDPSIIRQMTRMGAGAGLGGQAAFPAPGTTDNTPGAEGQQQSAPSQQQGQQQPVNPFASLFGGAGAGVGAQPGSPNPNAGLSALFGGIYPPGVPPSAQGSQPGSPPPEQPPMGVNPFPNPAALQQMMQLMGGVPNPTGSTPSSDANSPPVNPFAGLFGGIPPYAATSPTPPDTRPPEERYADQLRQLNDMGFFDFDRNVEALRRSGGSVQGAINQLLGG
jgi:ubiquilin